MAFRKIPIPNAISGKSEVQAYRASTVAIHGRFSNIAASRSAVEHSLAGRRTALRQIWTGDQKSWHEFGPFRVDPDKQLLLRENQPVPITPKAFETLLILIRHHREVVSKDDLMKELWPDAFVEDANLSQNIFMLRKALGDTPEARRYIVTLPGRGYRFATEVRTVAQARAISQVISFGGIFSRLQVRENLVRAQQVCDVWAETYPHDPMPHMFLSGAIDPVVGKYPHAKGQGKSIRISPSYISSWPIGIRGESLDVPLAYLKGKDAESEEAQEHANSSLALYA